MRVPCPPGACTCNQASLLADPAGDLRVLKLTREEEKRLIAHIESVSTLPDLWRVRDLIDKQLGVRVHITPSARGVRTARGIEIKLEPRQGLCSKTHQTLPAAFRRCLAAHDAMVFALLDSEGLPGLADSQADDAAASDNARRTGTILPPVDGVRQTSDSDGPKNS